MRGLVILAVLLTACGSAPSPTELPPTPSKGVETPATATPVQTATPTPTAIPSTSTPTPTDQPTSTLAPAGTATETREPIRLIAATLTSAPTSTRPPAPTATRVPATAIPPTAISPTTMPPTSAPAPTVAPVTRVAPISVSDCPAGYPIKGNRGDNGWIYHVPGGASYKATHPEDCFSTEAAAVAAGYRKALK